MWALYLTEVFNEIPWLFNAIKYFEISLALKIQKELMSFYCSIKVLN